MVMVSAGLIDIELHQAAGAECRDGFADRARISTVKNTDADLRKAQEGTAPHTDCDHDVRAGFGEQPHGRHAAAVFVRDAGDNPTIAAVTFLAQCNQGKDVTVPEVGGYRGV
ncbi:MAG: hypothetical protein WCF85_10075 [Rhodospirillaceae bacterium]